MRDRFVITGSSRCGTTWMSRALTQAGVPCGHEEVFHPGEVVWPDHLQADSSWLAATKLDQVDVPVVLMVRHPLAVVRSLVEIGFFAEWDQDNPGHSPLRTAFPSVYDWATPQDRALEMWLALTTAVLGRAELVIRLEGMDTERFSRLLRWCGAIRPESGAAVALQEPPCNRHEESRQRTGVVHQPSWGAHNPILAGCAQELATTLGYMIEGE